MRFPTLVAFILPLSALAAPVLVTRSIAKSNGFFQMKHGVIDALLALGKARFSLPSDKKADVRRTALDNTSSPLTALKSSKEFNTALDAASNDQDPAANDAKNIQAIVSGALTTFNNNLGVDAAKCDRNLTEDWCNDIVTARDAILSALTGAVVMTG